MIQCKCGATLDDIKYRGPVLIAEGTATIGDDGQIKALGPARALQTIKAGDELKQLDGMLFMCPKCGGKGSLDEMFKLVRTCYITGIAADLAVDTPIGTFWVSERHADTAREVFTLANSVWEMPFDSQEL